MDVVDLVSDDEEDLLDAAYVKEEYDEDQEGMEFGDQDGYFSEYTEEPMENIKQEGDSSMNNTNEQNSPQKTFSCDECSRVYHNRQSLWYHKKTHNPDPPESCSVCEKIFTNPVSLRKHMRAHDREMRMASGTQQSLKSVETEVLPSYSQTVVKEEPKYDAPLTLQDYHWAEEAEDTGQKRFQCTLCPRSYVQSYNLTRHYRMHKLGVFSCDICRLTFKKQTYLINHKKTHENKEINEQKNRPRTPKTKVKAEYNIPSRFPRLAKTAANAATLQQQQIPVVQQPLPPVKPRPTATKVKRSNPKQKRFQCEKCFTTFKHSRNLFRHRQLHLRKGPFSCDICGICFPEEKSMNLHRGKHPDMTPLAQKIAENTELAEESWESIGEQYTVTMEVGTDEIETSSVAKDEDDPYKCTVCNVFFKIADNFERTHEMEAQH
uniref:C2H2-type domain-containing protein n=1 Tax=Lutzomyia longipalpis TaxID=7200 RepID=A0A1B0EVS2_LUTLO